MPHIQIPDSLFMQIEQALPPSASPEEFVVQAVREKLSFEDQKKEFYRISDRNRAAMIESELSEDGILRDFDSGRGNRDH
jgi:hypothetical protein